MCILLFWCLGMPCEPVVGGMVLGCVRRVLAHEGLLVTLPGYTGRVDITDISDHYTSNPLSRFRKSQLIRFNPCNYQLFNHSH